MDILINRCVSFHVIDVLEDIQGYQMMVDYIDRTDNEIVIEKMLQTIAVICNNPEAKTVRMP